MKTIVKTLAAAAMFTIAAHAQTVETLPIKANTLAEPFGVAVDPHDNAIYVTDGAHDRIIKMEQVGAGKPAVTRIHSLGISPEGIAYLERSFPGNAALPGVRRGLVYASAASQIIGFYDLASDTDLILAGAKGVPDTAVAGPVAGLSARFSTPSGVAAASDGTVYVADLQNAAVRVIDTDGANSVTTLSLFDTDGVTPLSIGRPSAVAVNSGTLFVTDIDAGAVLAFSLSGVNATLIGTSSGFSVPSGLLWVGGSLGLLVTDTQEHAIFTASHSLFSGSDSGTFGSSDGSLEDARYKEPVGLAIDNLGRILVADLKNNVVRRISREQAPLPGFSPAPGTFFNTVTLAATNSAKLADRAGTVFRYTTDDTDPTSLSPAFPKVSGVATLVLTGGPVNLRVRAFHPNYVASEVLAGSFQFAVGAITNLPPAGVYTNDVDVSYASLVTEGVTFRFLTEADGDKAVEETAPAWTDQPLSATTTLRVRGFRNGFTPSSTSTNLYSFKVGSVDIHSDLTFSTNQTINVDAVTGTAGAKLFYFVDNGAPVEIIGNNFDLSKSGRLGVYGTRAGYANSDTNFAQVVLTVSDPVISPNGGTNINQLSIKLTSATPDAHFFYTLNGDEPVPLKAGTTEAAGGALTMDASATLKVIATRDGFLSSKVVKADFKYVVSDLVMDVTTSKRDNDVPINFETETTGAVIRYTVDDPFLGPTKGAVAAGGSLLVQKSGTYRIQAFKTGYDASAVITTNITLAVANPKLVVTAPLVGAAVLEPVSGVYSAINKLQFSLSTTTVGATVKYTLDGSDPATSATAVVYSAPVVTDVSKRLRVAATKSGYSESQPLSVDLEVIADTPTMNPPGGFFQEGTQLTFTVNRTTAGGFSTESFIYYTVDGSAPSRTNGFKAISGKPFTVSAVELPPGVDLTQIRALAAADGVTSSAIISGAAATENTIGITRPEIHAGIGAKIVVPVVVSLKPGVEIRSLQYRLTITPQGSAPNLGASDAVPLAIKTNSFLLLSSAKDGSQTNLTYVFAQTGVSPKVNDIAIAFLGGGDNLLLKGYNSVNFIAIDIPKGAASGDKYLVQILNPSATADAAQHRVPIKASADVMVVIENHPYIVGDTSPGRWFNADDITKGLGFGDGDLDNSDVNNALYASLDFKVPEVGTDVFDAMDAWPLDRPGVRGGDKKIRQLDWETILFRSLRKDPNIWYRVHGAGGKLLSGTTNLTANGEFFGGAAEEGASDVEPLWVRQAAFEAGNLPQSAEGAIVRVPVFLNVKPGAQVDGMSFRATVQASDGAPALTDQAIFVVAGGLPAGITLTDGLGLDEVAHAWSLQSPLKLRGKIKVGDIVFTTPATAKAGDCYTIVFNKVDGVTGDDVTTATPYDFESRHGCVAIRAEVVDKLGSQISDEWRTHFFGSLNNLLSDLNGDADGDGIPNWKEFQDGTNPTELRFHHGQTVKDLVKSGFKLKFFAKPGISYVVESASSLAGPWETVVTGVTGDGTLKEFLDGNTLDKTKFYRVRAL